MEMGMIIIHLVEYGDGDYIQNSLSSLGNPLECKYLIWKQEDIAEMARTFSTWMLPHLFAYAIVFPCSKFL
jgi:hypothetical protein